MAPRAGGRFRLSSEPFPSFPTPVDHLAGVASALLSLALESQSDMSEFRLLSIAPC